MAASTYFDQVQQLYIAYFGRPADTVGQAYWATQIAAANGSIASVIAGFSASAESVALFGSATSAQKVTAIYQNAFGRAPEATGLAYWVAQLDSGKVSQAQASWTIQQAAGPGDASAVNNKLIAAKAFTAQIDTNAEITGYNGAAAAALARAYLTKADATYASISNVAVDSIAAVATATGTGVVTPPVTPTAFTATVTSQVVAFGGTATGDISVTWSGTPGTSGATFIRDGNYASPIAFGGTGATSVSLASTEVLAGTAATLANLTVTGAGTGGVHLTDIAASLAGKFIAANTLHDVLTVSNSPAASTSLANLTGFETIHLAGSTAVVTIANGAGTLVDTSAAAIVTLGAGGQTFNGSAFNDVVIGGTGSDIISGGASSNILTGGAGNDTFNIATTASDRITDLSGSDVLVNSGTVVADNVSSFTATASTVNTSTVTLIAGTLGSTINLSAATGTNGFTIVGGAGIDILTGSARNDTLTGGTGADTLTGGTGVNTFVYTAGDSAVGAFDSITDFKSTDLIKTGVVAAGVYTDLAYTAAGTGVLLTDIAAAINAGTIATSHTAVFTDAYVVTLTGTGAGIYLVQDTGTLGFDASDLLIQLTGASNAALTTANIIV